jgi:hypothetical protein
MGRRNKPRRRPQADKRVRLVGVRRVQVDQRKLGRALLRIIAIETAKDGPESAASGPNESAIKPGSVSAHRLERGDDDDGP